MFILTKLRLFIHPSKQLSIFSYKNTVSFLKGYRKPSRSLWDRDISVFLVPFKKIGCICMYIKRGERGILSFYRRERTFKVEEQKIYLGAFKKKLFLTPPPPAIFIGTWGKMLDVCASERYEYFKFIKNICISFWSTPFNFVFTCSLIPIPWKFVRSGMINYMKSNKWDEMKMSSFLLQRKGPKVTEISVNGGGGVTLTRPIL